MIGVVILIVGPTTAGWAMAEIQLVDVSLRDGNQSLWGATGLRTAHIATIAPLLGRAGFRALDYSSSTAMGVSVRTHREDPWALLRLARAAMPDTLLQFIGTGFRFISWERAHPEVIQLVYSALVRNGMDRFVVLDPTHDMDAARATAAIAKKAGAREVVGALTYTISAVHDDAFYARVAAAYADCPDIDRAYIKDPAGILTPDRARTLIPAVQAELRGRADNDTGKPLELHSHASLGLSPLTCLVAAELGVPVLQVGCGALGNGTSLPDAEDLVANLRASGHTVDIDDRLLAAVARYFDRLAGAEGLPRGEHRGFDAAFMDHQLAGGVMSTTRRQLAELGQQHRFDALMAEISLVRAELGYPIMVTPFPQMVIGQALANLLSAAAVGGARYDSVPDQVIRYVLGTFGKPTAPVEPWVLDRVLNRPRAAELADEPEPLDVAALRKRFGMRISDEELVLRFGLPGPEVDAMIAAGPAVTHYNPDLVPVLKLLRELGQRPAPRELTVDKPAFRLSLRSNGR
jgi:oxaloacetate decarboxylase alpha subunit